MHEDKHANEVEIDEKTMKKFEPHIARAGGIFTPKRRKQLLGKIRKVGGRVGGETINQWWYKTRNSVRTALVDLDLFIEVAGRDNVNQVVTEETLEPIAKILLLKPTIYKPVIRKANKEEGEQQETEDAKHKKEEDEHQAIREPPDIVRAKIAQLFIRYGFDYLQSMQMYHVTLSHKRTIDEAINLSDYLVESFKPENERRHTAFR